MKREMSAGLPTRLVIAHTLLTAAYGANVHAQIVTASADAPASLEVVIVTAERRAESVQDTPIAISAFTGESLQELGLTTVEDLAEVTPSLQIFAEQINNEAYIIRGIGRSNEDLTTDSGVAVYINDVYIAQPAEANAAFYDIERVEVLRGPQGTLYGKNAVGGVINLITRKPDDELSASLSAEAGSLGLQTYTGAVGGPLVEGIAAARIAGYYSRNDGAYNNLTTGEDANGVEIEAARGSLRLTPSDRLEINLVLDASDSTQDGVLKSVISDYDGARYVLKDFFEVDEFPAQEADIRSSRSETNGRQGIRQWGGSLRTDYSTDGGTLSWLAGYRTEESYNLEDIDRTERLINNFEGTQDTWSSSHELRFVSADDGALSAGGRLQWSAGLYWFHEEGWRNQDIYLRARVPSSSPGDPDNPDDGLLGPGTPDVQDSTASFLQTIETDSYAAFGQAKYHVTPTFGITLGLRYTDETKRASVDATSVGTAGGDPYSLFQPNGPYSRAQEGTWTMLTPKLVLEYEAAQDIHTYASYARGFKSGGFNGQSGTFEELEPFEPEQADNYEIGIKSDLFANRLRLNLAAFQINFEDLQIAGTNAQGLVVTTNAADSRIRGIELEASALPTPALTLRAAVSLLEAEFRNYFVEEFDPTITDGPPFVIVDKEGDRLDDVPEYSVALGADYKWLLEGGSDLSLGVDGTIKGDTVSNQDTLRASSYSVFNTRLGWTSADGAWTVAAWVRNLTDEVYYRGGGAVPDFDKHVARVGLVADPRTYGITITYTLGK
jgi:iron complex outermembrane recepter protein